MAKKGAQERRGVTVLDRTDISLINGNVLAEINPEEYMMLPSGMILGDAESFLEQHRFYEASGHSIRHGRVVTLPKEKTITNSDMTTEVRVEVGDMVWWFYDVGNNAEVCKFEDKFYYILNYTDMIVLKRGDYIETLNGHLLCETEKRYAKSKFDVKHNAKNDTFLSASKGSNVSKLMTNFDRGSHKNGKVFFNVDLILSEVIVFFWHNEWLKTINI